MGRACACACPHRALCEACAVLPRLPRTGPALLGPAPLVANMCPLPLSPPPRRSASWTGTGPAWAPRYALRTNCSMLCVCACVCTCAAAPTAKHSGSLSPAAVCARPHMMPACHDHGRACADHWGTQAARSRLHTAHLRNAQQLRCPRRPRCSSSSKLAVTPLPPAPRGTALHTPAPAHPGVGRAPAVQRQPRPPHPAARHTLRRALHGQAGGAPLRGLRPQGEPGGGGGGGERGGGKGGGTRVAARAHAGPCVFGPFMHA